MARLLTRRTAVPYPAYLQFGKQDAMPKDIINY
jgi:hypothetical protein